jgi:hypothetical protein
MALLPITRLGATIPGFDLEPAYAAGAVTIEAFDRETGSPVENFRYLINEDIAHANPLLTPPASYSPVAATGTHLEGDGPETVDLPDGKYLLTVDGGAFPDSLAGEFPAADYKLWGEHFEVAGGDLTVPVDLVPNPLPTATLRVRVFQDNNLVNGEDDIPLEAGIEGFNVHIADPVGEVDVDFFGNPLCTQYDGDPNGAFPPGNPIPGTGGQCVSDAEGHAVIANLPPGKYEVEVIPPNGSGWRQTTTIEGYSYVGSGFARDGTVITASNSPLPPEFTAPPPMLAAQGNQVRDCYDPDGAAPFTINPRNAATCEPGLPGQDLDVRQKDGSLQYATFADTNGHYAFPEYFEWEHFLTWEVGYGRFRQEGTSGYATDFGGEPLGYPYAPVHRTDPGLAALLSPQMTAAGTTTWIDTGKQAASPGRKRRHHRRRLLRPLSERAVSFSGWYDSAALRQSGSAANRSSRAWTAARPTPTPWAVERRIGQQSPAVDFDQGCRPPRRGRWWTPSIRRLMWHRRPFRNAPVPCDVDTTPFGRAVGHLTLERISPAPFPKPGISSKM